MAKKVTVVGVGMVGEQIISILKERRLPIEWPPRVCATRERKEILAGENYIVEKVSEDSFKDADVVLFAGKEGAKGASVTWRASAEEAGAICIDNGSDFRMDSEVPLVVPEVNFDAIGPNTQFIASPNCSTIQMVMVPALVGHGESINIETESKISVDDVRKILSESEGVTVIDDLCPENARHDPLERTYPTIEDLRMPQFRDEVLVGRIREDETMENGLKYFISRWTNYTKS